MAKKHSTDKEKLSVSEFVSRPVIHSSSCDGTSKFGTFNFSDSLVRFGSSLTMTELEEANKRAGAAFKGLLQQNFVVLTDRNVTRTQSGGPWAGPSENARGSPRKRLRDGETGLSEIRAAESKTKVVRKA
jgi:hypothetical protein